MMDIKLEGFKGNISMKFDDKQKREDQIRRAITAIERRIMMIDKKLLDQSSAGGGGGHHRQSDS
jgi:hypothetical protein